ncbi:MAG: rod shape-determining protein MreD [Pseudomonadota bacterium]
MGSAPWMRRALYAALYAGVCLAIMLVHMLPKDLGPNGYPPPDILLCLTFAWVLRRPHLLPTPLVAAVFLLADFLLMRPPGLWTALSVVAVEYLRSREPLLRELPLAAEFGAAAAALVFVPLSYHLTLMLFGVPNAGFGLMVLQAIATLLFYPLLVFALKIVFGIDRMTPSEAEAVRILS